MSGDDEVELLDAAGNALGRFLSEQGLRRLVIDWANANISTAELEASPHEPGACSHQGFWKRTVRSHD